MSDLIRASLDAKLLAELVSGKKTRSDFEPTDPIFLAAAIVEKVVADAHKKMLDDVTKVVTGFVDQVSTANVLASNMAKAKAETTVTAAAQWAADHLKAAGVDAGKLAAGPVEEALERAAHAARTATIAAWVGCAGAVVSAAIAVMMVFVH